MRDIVLAEEFAPFIGGAHLWMYEVYRRWPHPVCVIARDYSEVADLAPMQAEFDRRKHGVLKLQRVNLEFETWGVRSFPDYMQLCRIAHSNLSNQGPTRIHCLKALPEALSTWPLKFRYGRRIRVITYAHGEEYLIAKTSRELSYLTRKALQISDLVIANSESTAAIVRSIEPNARIAVIHPGICVSDYDTAAERRNETRNLWGWPEETVVLAMVARMEPRKNHATVLQSLAELRREGVPLACVIGSDGAERQRLQEMTKRLDITAWVLFTGRITDMEKRDILAAADIHIMPSIQVGPMIEGFGIVFLEAAAAGIPSIAGNVGGQGEAVLHGKTGLVVDGTSVKQVKEAIRQLAGNPDLRRRMGKEGRLWAVANDWDIVSRRTIDVLDSRC